MKPAGMAGKHDAHNWFYFWMFEKVKQVFFNQSLIVDHAHESWGQLEEIQLLCSQYHHVLFAVQGQEKVLWQRRLEVLLGICESQFELFFKAEVCFHRRPRLQLMTSRELEWRCVRAADKCFSMTFSSKIYRCLNLWDLSPFLNFGARYSIIPPSETRFRQQTEAGC